MPRRGIQLVQVLLMRQGSGAMAEMMPAEALCRHLFVGAAIDGGSLEHQLRALVRDVPDFPKPGILFHDLTR